MSRRVRQHERSEKGCNADGKKKGIEMEAKGFGVFKQ